MQKTAEQNYRKLQTTGRVEIPQSMAHFAFLMVLCVLMAAGGLWIMADAIGPGEPWYRAFGHFNGWIGLVTLLFTLTVIVVIPIQMRQRASLTITWGSIEEHRTRGGKRELSFRIPWNEVELVSGRRYGGRGFYKGQLIIQLTLSPGAYLAYRQMLTPVMRSLEAANAGISAPRTISLHRYAGGQKAMLELLDRVHRDLGASPAQWQHGS